MPIVKTVLIFLLAGLCEIGGGYLIWISVREGKSNMVCISWRGSTHSFFTDTSPLFKPLTSRACIQPTEASSLVVTVVGLEI